MIRSTVIAVALALVGGAALAESAVSEHQEKWDALRERRAADAKTEEPTEPAERDREEEEAHEPEDERSSDE